MVKLETLHGIYCSFRYLIDKNDCFPNNLLESDFLGSSKKFNKHISYLNNASRQ